MEIARRQNIFIALSSSFLLGIFSSAFGYDDSNWTYDELRQTAAEKRADGNYKGALKYFDKAVHAEPNNPEGYINRGAVFELLNNEKQAIADEEQAIALAKSNSKGDLAFRSAAHQNLAGIHLNHHRNLEAEAEARSAVQLTPNDPTVQEYLADLLTKIGKKTEAILFLYKAEQEYERWKDSSSVSRIQGKIKELQNK